MACGQYTSFGIIMGSVPPSIPAALAMKKLVVGLLLFSCPASALAAFRDSFDQPDGLITDEFAYYNPGRGKSSPNWEVTSGALSAHTKTGWSNSPVFRMLTRRRDFGDVAVTLRLLNSAVGATSRTPAQALDGAHLFLRHQGEAHTYYVSVNRRDNTVVIKKKVPGGPVNGGTYYNLAGPAYYGVPYGAWQQFTAIVRNEPDGSVSLTLATDGRTLLSARDNGIGGPPIRQRGAVGLRGDNADLYFDDFSVTALGEGAVADPSPSPAPAAPELNALAPQRFLSPALADGINDAAVFGPDAKNVSVMNLDGLVVFEGSKDSGGSLVWRGRDRTGSVVASGVYICRIIRTDSKAVYQTISVVK
jgi:hypothetical protein